MIIEMNETEATQHHADHGGYMLRSGTCGMWIVVPVIDVHPIDGFRDGAAYGVDIYATTEIEWEKAGWREDRLPGYRA